MFRRSCSALLRCSSARAALSRLRRAPSPLIWTCLGGLAIPLWATWPALSLKTAAVPPLGCLTFGVAWLALSGLERTEQPASGGASWIPVLMFAVGESGAAVLFLLATHHMAAAEANLITHLWP
jgi:hypothetical protein